MAIRSAIDLVQSDSENNTAAQSAPPATHLDSSPADTLVRQVNLLHGNVGHSPNFTFSAMAVDIGR